MENKRQSTFPCIFALVIIAGLLSLASCMAAEAKKTKEEDLKVDGKLCYAPRSQAFGYGIAAAVTLFVAQAFGNLVVCKNFCEAKKKKSWKAHKPTTAIALLAISWIGFGLAIAILLTATSMNSGQSYGKGWLNGECYLVKTGIFIGSAGLVFVTVSCLLGSAIVTIRSSHVDQALKVHDQVLSHSFSTNGEHSRAMGI